MVGNLDHNIVWWSGLSKAAFDAVGIARDEKMIKVDVANFRTYLLEGTVMDYPIAVDLPKSGRFEELHWGPVLFVSRKVYDARRKANPDEYPEEK